MGLPSSHPSGGFVTFSSLRGRRSREMHTHLGMTGYWWLSSVGYVAWTMLVLGQLLAFFQISLQLCFPWHYPKSNQIGLQQRRTGVCVVLALEGRFCSSNVYGGGHQAVSSPSEYFSGEGLVWLHKTGLFHLQDQLPES